jgi:hypothetical protein
LAGARGWGRGGSALPLVWLDEKVSLELKQVPLVRPQVPETPVWRLADWEHAAFLEKHRSGTEKAGEAEAVTRAGLMAAASLTPQPFFDALARELTGVREAALPLERELGRAARSRSAALRQLRASWGTSSTSSRSLRGTRSSPGRWGPCSGTRLHRGFISLRGGRGGAGPEPVLHPRARGRLPDALGGR